MKKVLLLYPPSKLYQRGEDRSQGNIEDSTSTSVRASNDLGYASSVMKKEGFDVFLRDYQTEGLTMEDVISDAREYQPDIIFMSITNSTIFEDLDKIRVIKKEFPSLTVILKGALFFDPDDEMLDQLDLEDVDYLVGGESDFIVGRLVKAHFDGLEDLSSIRGILYRRNGDWIRTDFKTWETDLDEFPFPDRDEMNNSLYVRPDTGEPQATIATSRGCPASCIYCLTPEISGQKLRLRSPQNIVEELVDCYEKHNIRNFFFKSDTFTIHRHWVKELCTLILDSKLKGKIEWVANSRVNPLQIETLEIMKEAGCWLVAFGYESGSPETLEKVKKGATVEDNLRASKLMKEVGLKSFGFFLIGLPWENWDHLYKTRAHMLELDPDFIELHIAVPYYGTELFEVAKKEGLIDDTVLGKDYFNTPTIGTKYLKIEDIQNFQRKTILQYHLRPSYILNKVKSSIAQPKVLAKYFSFGMKLLRAS